MDLLRLATSGSVDDGKSTLIGRLFYDTKSIFEDQLALLEEASKKRAKGPDIDLSLLTDGLKAEREQGITIDVAYRYFSTPKRKFILADTPGHVQYTRNMITGAADADVLLVLIDAQKGISEQTRRHTLLAALMGVKRVVACINKMDLVVFSQEVYDRIVANFGAIASKLALKDVTCIPLSALKGDNIVDRSVSTPWYDGPTLLEYLESATVEHEASATRFVIQMVARKEPGSLDRRGYAGVVASGTLRVGEEVLTQPSGLVAKVAAIETFDGSLQEAHTGKSVNVFLDRELDLGRGDILSAGDNAPNVSQEIDVVLCWMDTTPLKNGHRYDVLHGTSEVQCLVRAVHHHLDVHTLDPVTDRAELGPNDIARATLRLSRPIASDAYASNRTTGSLLLVDPVTNRTAAAGLIL
jgi:sulfate adenylyltransferase large subunit